MKLSCVTASYVMDPLGEPVVSSIGGGPAR